MKSIKLTDEEIVSMSYDDVAYKILEAKEKKMKIQDLFKEVIKVMKLDDSVFEAHLADFFELLSTDKRFMMLDKGYWDLKVNHKTKVVIEEDEEEEIIDTTEEVEDEEEEEDINYDEEIIDDDAEEDELKDLVIMDEGEENEII